MGASVVELACKAAKGETVEDVDSGCQWYTAENMNDEEIAQNCTTKANADSKYEAFGCLQTERFI